MQDCPGLWFGPCGLSFKMHLTFDLLTMITSFKYAYDTYLIVPDSNI